MATAAAVKPKQEFTYTWEGTDRKNAKIKGTSVGPNEGVIKQQLLKQGIRPIRVKKKGGMRGRRKITSGDIAIFSRQLAVMMAAGVPLVQSLEIVGRGHDNPSMGQMILQIKAYIEGG